MAAPPPISKEIILTSSDHLPIAAYDLSTATKIAQFSGSRSPRGGLTLAGTSIIAASHVSPDTLLSGSINLYLWWSTTPLLTIPTPDPVAFLASTPDGSYLFAGGLTGRIHSFSLPSGEKCSSVPAHRKPVSCLAVTGDGSLLVSGCDDGEIVVIPITKLLDGSIQEYQETAQVALHQIRAHDACVTCIALSLDGCSTGTVISSSLDCKCKVWSMADMTHLHTVVFQCEIWCVVTDLISFTAYAGGADGRVYVACLNGRRGKGAIEQGEAMSGGSGERCGGGAVIAMAMANGDRSLVSASEDGEIRVWDASSRSVVRVLGVEKGSISDLLVVKEAAGAKHGYNWGNQSSGSVLYDQHAGMLELEEMKEQLRALEEVRKRNSDELDAVIDTYQRLMKAVLEEVKESGRDDGLKRKRAGNAMKKAGVTYQKLMKALVEEAKRSGRGDVLERMKLEIDGHVMLPENCSSFATFFDIGK